MQIDVSHDRIIATSPADTSTETHIRDNKRRVRALRAAGVTRPFGVVTPSRFATAFAVNDRKP
jgi:hypothetical protein